MNQMTFNLYQIYIWRDENDDNHQFSYLFFFAVICLGVYQKPKVSYTIYVYMSTLCVMLFAIFWLCFHSEKNYNGDAKKKGTLIVCSAYILYRRIRAEVTWKCRNCCFLYSRQYCEYSLSYTLRGDGRNRLLCAATANNRNQNEINHFHVVAYLFIVAKKAQINFRFFSFLNIFLPFISTAIWVVRLAYLSNELGTGFRTIF